MKNFFLKDLAEVSFLVTVTGKQEGMLAGSITTHLRFFSLFFAGASADVTRFASSL